jgi:uncharacterized SAM-dependent methyltransferase
MPSARVKKDPDPSRGQARRETALWQQYEDGMLNERPGMRRLSLEVCYAATGLALTQGHPFLRSVIKDFDAAKRDLQARKKAGYQLKEAPVPDVITDIGWRMLSDTHPNQTLPGSDIFDTRISEEPGYHVSRADNKIIESGMGGIIAVYSYDNVVIDLGCASGTKTVKMMNRFPGIPYAYYAVDYIVDNTRAAVDLVRRHVKNEETGVPPITKGIVANFTTPAFFQLPFWNEIKKTGRKKVFLLLGSTICNYPIEEVKVLLKNIRANMDAGDHLIVSIDSTVDPEALRRAYHNRSVAALHLSGNYYGMNLHRHYVNDFAAFGYRAWYNEHEKRVRMECVSLEKQTIFDRRGYAAAELKKNETILGGSAFRHSIEEWRGPEDAEDPDCIFKECGLQVEDAFKYRTKDIAIDHNIFCLSNHAPNDRPRRQWSNLGIVMTKYLVKRLAA